MSKTQFITCPSCGTNSTVFKSPVPTVDIIIELEPDNCNQIILIERKNEPFGWAIPGGFVDYGESVEEAAIREAKEETNLEVELSYLLGVYSDPDRDQRKHTISTVFVAKALGQPKAGDDAKQLALFDKNGLPSNLAFDHRKILKDYFRQRMVNT